MCGVLLDMNIDAMCLRVYVLHSLRVVSSVSSVAPHSGFLCLILGNAAVPVRQIRRVTTCGLIFLSIHVPVEVIDKRDTKENRSLDLLTTLGFVSSF